MPAKNKTQKNGFYFYMQDLIPMLKREGRVFPGGMADVVTIAHPRWKVLDEKEKERYENKAKEYKRMMRGQPGDDVRMDSVGNIIAHRKDEVSEYETARERELKDLVFAWRKGGVNIIQEKFYFIDVQVLCKTEEDEYLPVELALIEFSFQDGISKVYHEFLDPGEMPKGMRYECERNSQDTHKIPTSGHPNCKRDYLSVQNMIENFINPQGMKPRYPPIFALREDWNKVNWTLSYIRGMSCIAQSVTFKVYELESLFNSLIEYSGKGNASTKALAHEKLTTTLYDYHRGIKCDFHEDLECKHCSLLHVKRFCYVFADSFTGCYPYELKPHKHLPVAKPAGFVVVEDDDEFFQQAKFKPQNKHSAEMVYSAPSNMPKTQSAVLANRIGAPAPVIRPYSQDSYRSAFAQQTPETNPWSQPQSSSGGYKTSFSQPTLSMSQRAPAPIIRPSSSDTFRTGLMQPTHSMSGNMSTPVFGLSSAGDFSQGDSEEYSDDLEYATGLEQRLDKPSSVTGDLVAGRASTWIPQRSVGSWSRTSTPASTPRATPLPTPLPTPQHSPPRPGAKFPNDRTGSNCTSISQEFQGLSLGGRGTRKGL